MALLKLQHKNGATLINLGEDLNVSNARELYADLGKALKRKPDKIIFYAGKLTRFDTAVLQLLIACTREAIRLKKTVSWAETSEEFRECIEYAGMDEVLGLHNA
ncbi:MAG: lipid asymmetry maintenance protein MlaB [Acidiferrobacterales bacterium]